MIHSPMDSESFSILTINGGSSSIKFALYGMDEKILLKYSGAISHIGSGGALLTIRPFKGEEKKIASHDSDFHQATLFLINFLEKETDFKSVKCIAHRIVHGMNHTHAGIIDENLLNELKNIGSFDPEHMPSEIFIIERCKEKFPDLLQIACFDTSFHRDMPRVAKLLPIPRRFDEAGVQRYGFHGLSYTYLMEELHRTKGARANGRIILAHLGNGASMAAVKNGKSIDTSMGFTPAGGLVMGSRSGDLDPGVACYIMEKENLTTKQFSHLVNHESGMLGISGTSSDMEELLKKEQTDIRASEAIESFCYQAKKWIGAFTAALGGLDILVFSGGIGEHSATIRSRICAGMEYTGIRIDETENQKNAHCISPDIHEVEILVIPTNEEWVMANDAKQTYSDTKLNVQ
jgi:acetate kinase